MRIGLSTAAFYGIDETEDAAAHVAALGLPCCEVFLETYSEYSRAFGEIVAPRLGHTRCVSIHSKTQHFEPDILGQSVRQREDAFAMYDGFLQAGEVMGAHIYVFHGPANPRGTTPDFRRWREAIERALSMARARSIQLCWETVSWCHLNDPARVTEFLDIWPDLHFVLDLKQVFEMRHDPLDFIRAMGERLAHVHILDYDQSGRLCLPGRGAHDFRDVSRALRDIGYAGDVILEPYPNIVPNDAALMEAIDWLGDTFGAGQETLWSN